MAPCHRRVGAGRRRVPVVESSVRCGAVGVGDSGVGSGKLYLADPGDDPAQAGVGDTLRRGAGDDSVGRGVRSVLFRLLDLFFLRPVQTGMERRIRLGQQSCIWREDLTSCETTPGRLTQFERVDIDDKFDSFLSVFLLHLAD